MAGVYLYLESGNAARARSTGDLLQDYDDETRSTVVREDLTCIWSGVNDADLWGPAEDSRTGNFVVTSGRVSFEESEWRDGERLDQYDGGVSSRILLHAFNTGGIERLLGHNGPAIVLVWDHGNRKLHLLTDHMGYHPVFLYRPESFEHCVVSTAPDTIAGDPGCRVALDDVAIAEFLSGWRATPPNTYYREVKYAGAAAHHVWDLNGRTHRVSQYWKPFDEDFYRGIGEASEALEASLGRSIRIRTSARLSPVVSFTSGGLDSRAVLISAARDGDVIALNLYDRPGEDARIARALCEATGTRYVGFDRDPDYYPRLMETNVRVGNGMWCLEDQHYLGARDVVRELGARTVMTACTTDWVFKGYGLEKAYRRLLGRNLPIQRLTDQRVDAFLPNHRLTVGPRYENQIADRYEAWADGIPSRLATDRDRLLAEDKRVRPACYAVSVSGGIMYRAFPYDTFLGDRSVAECYSKLRPGWKLNSKIWGMTVRRMGGRAGVLPDSGSGFAPGDSAAVQILKFGRGWIGRRLPNSASRRLDDDSIVANGSWPNFGWLIRNSERIASLWSNAPSDDRELLNGVFADDLWAQDIGTWSRRPSDFFRMLTVLEWLELRRQPGMVANIRRSVSV